MKSETIFALFLSLSVGCSVHSKQTKGDEIVAKVENFRVNKHRLPKSLSAIGIGETEEGPIYYKQLSETRYQVWYGSRVGESVTYDSERRTWE
jgi:hypothetical protein